MQHFPRSDTGVSMLVPPPFPHFFFFFKFDEQLGHSYSIRYNVDNENWLSSIQFHQQCCGGLLDSF